MSMCDICLLAASLSLTSATTRQLLVSESAALKDGTQVHSNAFNYLSENGQPDLSIPIRRCPRKCRDILTWQDRTIDCEILGMVMFTGLTPLSLLISCKLYLPKCPFENVFLAYFGTEIFHKVFIWYLRNLLNKLSNSS
jgi:hypothetical protein